MSVTVAPDGTRYDTSGTNADSYTPGNCTWWVALKAPWIPAGLHDAGDWFANAKSMGLKTSSLPVLGSVVVYGKDHGYSGFGHVALVTSVNNFRGTGGTFQVSEMNFGELWKVKTDRQSTMEDVLGFILPPGSPGVQDAATIAQNQAQAAVQAILAPLGTQLEGSAQSFLTTALWGAEIALGGLLVLVTVAIMIASAMGTKPAVGARRSARKTVKALLPPKKKLPVDKSAKNPGRMKAIPIEKSKILKRKSVTGMSSADIARDRARTIRAAKLRHELEQKRKQETHDEIPF